MSFKYYTGIGSRETPREILLFMESIAEKLANNGWTLRSGGAKGADTAFEAGANRASGTKQIFLASDANEEALFIAQNFHPAWYALKSDYIKALMARNCFQVLGPDLKTPSNFVVCWTPDGSIGETTQKTGGTGQAIRIAKAYNIPIFNLARTEHFNRLKQWLEMS